MDEVALEIDNNSAETGYSYQIIRRTRPDGTCEFRIWRSLSAVRGGWVGQTYDTFPAAMKALLEAIE